MPDAANLPPDRFSGKADLYARFRPTYPDESVRAIIAKANLNRSSLLVDLGCGTGISSRLFAERGISVIGIEPNAGMRRRAVGTPCASGPPPHYRDGMAEATGLPDASADCVIAAQSFHWFDAGAALHEIHRILKPESWVALLWYERDESDEFSQCVGEVYRTGIDAVAIESGRVKAGNVLSVHQHFSNYERRKFRHASWLDEEALLGRAFSSSYAPKDDVGRNAWSAELLKLYNQYQIDGLVRLCYETTLHLAKRR